MSRATRAMGWVAGLGLFGAAHAALSAKAQRPAAVAHRPFSMEDEDRQLATASWKYFELNRQANGLVSSAAHFPATTMWDAGSQLAGMVAAHELGLLGAADFDGWMAQVLVTLASVPLYAHELPNKAYHAATLIPVDYGQLDAPREIGFSALDLGRLAIWLDIVAARYPQHAAACSAVTHDWRLARLVRDGDLMGTDAHGPERYNQEGRLGYAQYAAHGLAILGMKAPAARDAALHRRSVTVEQTEVAADNRDTHDSEAHNYVTSEPYVLDGLESGFQSLPEADAARLLLAQQRRFERTGQLTAWSEDNLDRSPWFVYNCMFVDGQAWTTLDSGGRDAHALRGSSLKAAIGWHVLFRTPYTQRLYVGLRSLADPGQGAFAGFYEESQQANAALTLNTNGIVLEALLYAHVGMPLEQWARQSAAERAP